MAFDNIVGGADETTPHAIKSLQSSMTKRKQIPSFCQGHVQSNGSKSFHKDLSVRLEREFGFDVCTKTSEKMSIGSNKSIKELKAENKELVS